MTARDDLDSIIESANRIRVTHVGALDPRHRGRTKPLAVATSVRDIRRLRDAVRIDAASLLDQMSIMTPGRVDLHFFRDHELLATVTVVLPGFVRWRGWPFDARLREPRRLAEWLRERGVSIE